MKHQLKPLRNFTHPCKQQEVQATVIHAAVNRNRTCSDIDRTDNVYLFKIKYIHILTFLFG